MANAISESYWEMIENYIYSMIKFELIHCSLMICVSDHQCMQLCNDKHFPCFDYQFKRVHPERSTPPSVMEQIAELKLFNIPRALAKSVDVFIIDLDVGFLEKSYDTPGDLL